MTTALRMANPAAWSQRHARSYVMTVDDYTDRHLCPCCVRFLSRQWFIDIWGCAPEDFRQGREYAYRSRLDAPDDFKDPSDDALLNREERGPR